VPDEVEDEALGLGTAPKVNLFGRENNELKTWFLNPASTQEADSKVKFLKIPSTL
jgi:hypothetical protein